MGHCRHWCPDLLLCHQFLLPECGSWAPQERDGRHGNRSQNAGAQTRKVMGASDVINAKKKLANETTCPSEGSGRPTDPPYVWAVLPTAVGRRLQHPRKPCSGSLRMRTQKQGSGFKHRTSPSISAHGSLKKRPHSQEEDQGVRLSLKYSVTSTKSQHISEPSPAYSRNSTA